MALLALALIPAMLLDDGASTATVHLIATGVNWFVWLAFCAEFAVRFAVAPDRRGFVRASWLDFVVIAVSPPFGVPEVLQSLRVLRAARLLKLLRLLRAAAFLKIGLSNYRRVLRHHHLHYVLAATAGIMLLGATGLFVFERDSNDAVTSFADALWWAVTTTTTVGYGDIYPKTTEGRAIAVVLMLAGIGMIGTFTATIASFFMVHEEQHESRDVQVRLERLEAKLDAVLAMSHRGRDKGDGGLQISA